MEKEWDLGCGNSWLLCDLIAKYFLYKLESVVFFLFPQRNPPDQFYLKSHKSLQYTLSAPLSELFSYLDPFLT